MYQFKLKLLYLFCCLLVSSGLAAQDASYFVYIQHEKHQPFYVKLEGKMLSSSVKGYVILPKLPQGKVPVTIGFPKSEAPEQSYVLRLTGQRDYGFLLKNTGDKEYALYDLQTFATLKSGGGAPVALNEDVTVTRISNENASAEQKEMINNVQADVEAALAKKPDTMVPRKKGGFAAALDKVVTDDRPEDMPLEAPKPKPVVVAADPAPVVAETIPVEAPPVKKPRGKKNRKEREALTDEERNLLSSVLEDEKKAAADEAVAVTPAATDSTVVESEVVAAPPVKKEKKSKKKKEQAEPEFINFGDSPAGAVPAPVVATEKAAEVVEDVVSQPEITAKEAREAKRQKRKAEKEAAERAAFVKDSIANVEFNSSTPVEPAEEKKPVIKMVNSDCEKILEVDAFRKLLRTMNSKKSDDDMVDAFRKGTRSVCISTEQARALTQLISTEESRYQLLDAAYARTYDTQNFSTLADLLKEDYYKGRFKAMLKK